jgi:hypothetical protein
LKPEVPVINWTAINSGTSVDTFTSCSGPMPSEGASPIIETEEGSPPGDLLALSSLLQQAELMDSALISSRLSGSLQHDAVYTGSGARSSDSAYQYALNRIFPTSKVGKYRVRSRFQRQSRSGLQSSSQEKLIFLNQLLAE